MIEKGLLREYMNALIRAALRLTVPQFTIIAPRTVVRGALWFTATSSAFIAHWARPLPSPPDIGGRCFFRRIADRLNCEMIR